MGRPSTPLLSPELIAEAALGLVDRDGEFTVAQVAAALKVRPSSLYNHVAGKAQIVEAMRGLIFRDVPRVPSGADGDWVQQVRVLLRAYRDAFAAHPRLVPMLTSQTVSSPDVMRIYDDLARILTDHAIPGDRLLDVITVLDSFVIGSALDAVAPDQVWDAEHAQDPGLAQAIRAAGAGTHRADRSFELGLDLLLAGLTHLAG
ncbi:MAG: TetR/AcrR family transcriptional regulator [Solirubrobacteraceae bacterium]